eukprot:3854497-Pleurochrysis_carterae.AAC.1
MEQDAYDSDDLNCEQRCVHSQTVLHAPAHATIRLRSPCISLTFGCVQCRLTIVDGAKSLAREYSLAYPLSCLFRCYRHLLADLQKTAT